MKQISVAKLNKFLPKWTKALNKFRIRRHGLPMVDLDEIEKETGMDWFNKRSCLVGEGHGFPRTNKPIAQCKVCNNLSLNSWDMNTASRLNVWKKRFLRHLKAKHPELYTKWKRRMK